MQSTKTLEQGISQKKFNFSRMNQESFQVMLDNNKLVLGSTFGDQFGLDLTSPSNHKVSSTI